MIVLIFATGIILGSFYNVCIYRIPKNESIVYPRSHCTKCNHYLSVNDLIPIISYILLKGKCRYCGRKISVKYPAVEIFTGLLFLLLYCKFGLSKEFLYYLSLESILEIIAFIDIDHKIIPNKIIAAAFIIWCIFIIFNFDIHIMDSIKGSIVSGCFYMLIYFITYLILKKDGIGFGDIKLMFIIGLFLGLKDTIITIIFSIYTGGIISILLIILKLKTKNDYIAYAPFIFLGTLINIFTGNQIVRFLINGW